MCSQMLNAEKIYQCNTPNEIPNKFMFIRFALNHCGCNYIVLIDLKQSPCVDGIFYYEDSFPFFVMRSVLRVYFSHVCFSHV